MNNLIGKNVVINGANTGIGKAVAMKCAKEGANVILAVRNRKKVENLQKQINWNYKFFQPPEAGQVLPVHHQ